MGNLLLVGARGSGKTAVGRRAAELLGSAWAFVEMDAALVARLGMPISEFFRVRGEEAFREEERALLIQIGRERRRIVACGGGVAGSAESLAAAREAGTLVWLDTPVPELVARRLADPGEVARPALLPVLADLKANDLEGYLHVEVPTILARRRAFYAGADFTLYTSGMSIERLAQIVCALAVGL